MSAKTDVYQEAKGSADHSDHPSMIELPVIRDFSSKTEETAEKNHPMYWRSASQLSGDPEFQQVVDSEFLSGAEKSPTGASRRQFLQIMGASMALAGLSACRRPVEKILPFAQKPEELIPGVPVNYATSMPFRGSVRGILVESTDGRPTKIEGNPDHPDSTGATGIFEQASLLDVYDPDRSQQVLRNGSGVSWSNFLSFVSNLPSSTRIAVITRPSSSATLARLREQIQSRFTSFRWVEYDAAGDDQALRATRSLFGRPLRARYNLANAKTIVSLDADFLGATDRDMVFNTSGFSAGRNPESRGPEGESEMNRLYVVESQYSITGAAADNRLRLRSADIPAFTAALANAMGLSVRGASSFADHAYISAVAEDLREAGTRGIVIPGENQSEDVHALAAAINAGLGAVGNTLTYFDSEEVEATSRISDLRNLVSDINSGSIDLLVMLGCNPVYDAPSDLGFKSAMANTSETIHVGLHVDETALASVWHIPSTHFLETWSDGRSFDGTRSVIQPLIAPLYEAAHSDLEVLGALVTGRSAAGYDLVRSTWRAFVSRNVSRNVSGNVSGDVSRNVNGNFEEEWQRILHDGFFPNSGYASVDPRLNTGSLPLQVEATSESGYEVVVRLDETLLDGSFSNNAWLQELPNPTTKVVWDNVAVMSPATAEALGVGMNLKNGRYFTDRISITADGRSIDLPVWIQPGLAEKSIGVQLGYGRVIRSERPERRTNIFDLDDYTDIYGHGAVASGVGVNVAAIRSSTAFSIIKGANVTRSGSGYMVASTQDHGALPVEGFEVERRGLYRAATVEEFIEHPYFVREMEPEAIREAWEDYPTLWEKNHPTTTQEFQENDYNQFQWGMVIDLNTCTGCNACTVACQAENNVQVVGKNEVSLGREMHWIRMDRYFVSGDNGSYDEPRMVVQPVPCMHCENAPCEQVCPVAATVHSPDGTNQMVYNRCIGTRYCANNCPYKVRRYNFYNWTKTLPVSIHMTQNPNVTVRSRGVMEKCSFCIQRIREVNKKMSVEKREMQTDEIQTACQQVCPAQAITFGDLADEASAVNEKKKSRRRYEMLAELNVKPRTSYLARIRNPNPILGPDA